MEAGLLTFGRLTILERNGASCTCRCECGRTVVRRWQSVKRGTTQSCGCLRAQQIKERTLKPIAEGSVFGRLTVLRWLGKWCECRCECGREVRIKSTRLRTDHTRSCGCLQKAIARETALHPIEPGTRFGKLVVTEQRGDRCECQCECGRSATVETKKLRNGHTTSCGCRRAELAQELAQSKMLPTGEAAFHGLYAQYRCQAAARKLEFALDEDAFRALTKQNCAYCGIFPRQVKLSLGAMGSYTYNGIDRIDNTAGYTSANSHPCCGTCNHAKADRSESDFLAWVTGVATCWVGAETTPSEDTGHTDLAACRKLFSRYGQTARRKRLDFSLSFEEFRRLIGTRCRYCGRPPHRPVSKGSSTVYTGLDRLDPAAGYTARNVVPCCWDCNNAKSVGSAEDFVDWARRVVKHRRLCSQATPASP